MGNGSSSGQHGLLESASASLSATLAMREVTDQSETQENGDPNRQDKQLGNGKTTHQNAVRLGTAVSNGDGFVVKRKGKRPPKDPSLSVEQRLAQAMAEQECDEAVPAASRVVGGGELVQIANKISVPAPVRRLRQKVPSSSGASSLASGSSFYSDSSSESRRGPLGLDDFEPLKVLGKGSFGKVYLVRHRENGRLFAMKQLKKADVLRGNQFENTKREFRVNKFLAQQDLSCPYIASLRYAFHSRSRLFLVHDFLAGGEMYNHLSVRGRLPETLACFYMAEIVLALGYLHSNSILYNDLKPENIMLDRDGHVVLVDLGLCLDGVRSATQGSTAFVGTTEYLSPEILRHEEHGFASDWWSCGMVAYEFITGLPPFYSHDQNQVVDGILSQTITFPSYVSPAARDLISQLLNKDASARLGSARDAEDLFEHPFFDSIDWVRLARRQIDPPFRPPSDDLTCNFAAEFTDAPVHIERDMPASRADPFHGWFFDCEDPVFCGGELGETV